MFDPFHGAKAALFIGDDLLVYQRDEDVAWGGLWDFPGGGRDEEETPFECLRREAFEEFGLTLNATDIHWQRAVPAMADPTQIAWFFVAKLPAKAARHIRFGTEGQRWALMALDDVMKLPNLVPALRDRLTLWLHAQGEEPIYTVGLKRG